MPDADERCQGCDRSIGWIDAASTCPNGCVYCLECASDAGGACPSCGEALGTRAARARKLPSPR